MNVLIIGNGGREHAIAATIKKSKLLTNLYVASGNYGTSLIATNLDIDITKNHEILAAVNDNKINLVIIGPENVLANGLTNVLRENNVMVLGPTKEAAQIESSKEFAKELMEKYNIPTATYKQYDDYIKALEHVVKKDVYPTVIKYDGLASGKGVFITKDLAETKDVLYRLLVDKELGNDSIIIEEFLEGDEFTLLALVNGDKVYPFQVARDFKRIGDNDTGLNTGGMGAICPYHNVNSVVLSKATAILKTTAQAMQSEGQSFCGVLYGGFITKDNNVKVIEFNARFGDPETECVLNNLESDLLENILDLLNDRAVNLKFSDKVSVGVVLSAPGYPNTYQEGINLNEYLNSNLTTYHMATKKSNDEVLSCGGRVLMLVNQAEDATKGFSKIYDFLKDKKGLYHRNDLMNY